MTGLTLRIWDISVTGDGVVEEVDTPVHAGLKAVKLSGNLNNRADMKFPLPEISEGSLKIYLRSDDFGTSIDIIIQVDSSNAIDILFDASDGHLKWYDGSSFNDIATVDPSGTFHELRVEWDVGANTVNVYWDGTQYTAGFRSRSDTPFILLTCSSGSGTGIWYVDDIRIENDNGIVFEDDFEPLASKISDIASFVNSVKDKNYIEEVFAYLATGDETYLNDAKNALSSYSPSATDLDFGYDLISASILALIDSSVIDDVRRLADYAVNNQNDIGLWDNGDGKCVTGHSSAIVEGLLWAYKVTGDSKYLNSAKKYLDKIEEIRNGNSGWIPRELNLDGSIAQSYPRYYDEMGTHAALNYFVYELTGDETYLNRAKAIIDVVVNNLWNNNGFLYSPNNTIYEIELSWFDPMLIMVGHQSDKALSDLLYRMLDENKGTAYTDNHLHGIEVSNDLVKHGVNTDGSDYTNHQSLFPANKAMPIALLYYAVHNATDLSKNIEVAIRALERHRKSNGYIWAIDPYSFAPDSYNPNPTHQHGFIYPYIMLLSLIKPPSSNLLPKHYGAYNCMFYANMRLDISSRALRGHFSAGTYIFYIGTKAVSYTFDEDGYYEIKFSDDFNSIESVTGLSRFTIIDYPSSVSVQPNTSFTIKVTVKNEGSVSGTVKVQLKDHNGNVVDYKNVSIGADNVWTVELSGTAPSEQGAYTWTVEAYNIDTETLDDSKTITVNVSQAMYLLGSIFDMPFQLLPYLIMIIIMVLLISLLISAFR